MSTAHGRTCSYDVSGIDAPSPWHDTHRRAKIREISRVYASLVVITSWPASGRAARIAIIEFRGNTLKLRLSYLIHQYDVDVFDDAERCKANEMADRFTSGPADYLAAERTFLAWIRTGLALMGFGFVVARFDLFLQTLQLGQPNLQLRLHGPSPWFGTALIILGVIVNVACAWNHIRLVQQLNRGEAAFARPSSLAVTVAVILAVLGLAMAIYLVSVRQPRQAYVDQAQEKSMTSNLESGIVTIPSHQSVDQTVQKLEGILKAKDVKLFALIDHSGEAEKVGMQMRPTKLLIFGNPKAGTPLMVASPSIAIDLPLKILVWEDASGKVQMLYNAPVYLQARHGLPAELVQNIAVVEALATKVAE